MLAKIRNLALVSAAIPFICGCGGAGIGLAALGSLFGGSSAAAGIAAGGVGGALASLAATGGAGAGVALATLHNPEPATLLLLGSGIAAMGIYKKNKKR